MLEPIPFVGYMEIDDMNANELATALFHYWNETERFAISETLLNDCANMLRQQQAEIDSLKDKLMLTKQSLEILEGWVKK